eukprot:15481203-Alexandrium_andersonii.AAC.1
MDSSSESCGFHTSTVGPRLRGPRCVLLIAPREAPQAAVARELQPQPCFNPKYKREKCRQLSVSPIDCSADSLLTAERAEGDEGAQAADEQ